LAYWVRNTAGSANVGVAVIARCFLKPISGWYGLEKILNQNRPVLVIGSIQLFNADTEFSGFNDLLSQKQVYFVLETSNFSRIRELDFSDLDLNSRWN